MFRFVSSPENKENQGWIVNSGSGNLVNVLAQAVGANPTQADFRIVVDWLTLDMKNNGYT